MNDFVHHIPSSIHKIMLKTPGFVLYAGHIAVALKDFNWHFFLDTHRPYLIDTDEVACMCV